MKLVGESNRSRWKCKRTKEKLVFKKLHLFKFTLKFKRELVFVIIWVDYFNAAEPVALGKMATMELAQRVICCSSQISKSRHDRESILGVSFKAGEGDATLNSSFLGLKFRNRAQPKRSCSRLLIFFQWQSTELNYISSPFQLDLSLVWLLPAVVQLLPIVLLIIMMQHYSLLLQAGYDLVLCVIVNQIVIPMFLDAFHLFGACITHLTI